MKRMCESQFQLLGSSISTEAVPILFKEKMRALKIMEPRLLLLPAHDALFILRHALALPRLLYTLRTCPTFLHIDILATYDSLLKDILSSVLNIRFIGTQFQQACLPVNNGGLGVRSAVMLAPSAFLASAAGTSHLVLLLLPDYITRDTDTSRAAALALWRSRVPTNTSPPASAQQKVWDALCVAHNLRQMTEQLTMPTDRARLNASQRKEAGTWLSALPAASLGLRMDDETIRIAVGLRLGCDLVTPHRCTCGAQVDATAHHGLSCRRSPYIG